MIKQRPVRQPRRHLAFGPFASCLVRFARLSTLLLGLVALSAPLHAAGLRADDVQIVSAPSLTGTITAAATGAPLANVWLQLFRLTGTTPVPPLLMTSTNANGQYAFNGLADGVYVLRTTNVLGYIDEVYDNRPCPLMACPATGGVGAGTPIAVVAGQTAVANFALDLGGTISGTVTNADGQPLTSDITIYNADGTFMTSYAAQAGGVFTVTGLADGNYYLSAGAVGYLNQLYSGVSCSTPCTVTPGTGTLIAVTAGHEVSGIEFHLTNRITLSNLFQVYDGTPRSVTVTTTPPGLAVTISYLGSAGTNYPSSPTPPTDPGTYTVTATLTGFTYRGSATATLTIANTWPGPGVQVALVDPVTHEQPVTLTFDQVTAPGVSQVATSASGPAVPANFSLVGGTYYQISTSAWFSGSATVCIAYSLPLPDGSAESDLQLRHFENDVWVALPTTLHDEENHRICATTTSFSPFAVFAPMPPVITIDSPREGATFTLGEVVTAEYGCARGSQVTPCSAVDETGAVIDSGARLDTSAPGEHRFVVTLSDGSGNVTTKSVTYTVAYGVGVLYDPEKGRQRGSTIPIRIRLQNAAGGDVSSSEVVVTAVALSLVSTATNGTIEDAGHADPDGNFRYTADGYVFNLQTEGVSTGTYELRFRCGADPTLHIVHFQVR